MSDKLNDMLKLYQEKVEELQFLIDRAKAVSDIEVTVTPDYYNERGGIPQRVINMTSVFDFMPGDKVWLNFNGCVFMVLFDKVLHEVDVNKLNWNLNVNDFNWDLAVRVID